MRRRRLSRSHLLHPPAAHPLGVFGAINMDPGVAVCEQTPIQLSSLAAQFVAVPEAGIRFHPAYESLSLPFAPNQGQTPSQVRIRTLDIGYHLSLNKNKALPELWQFAKIGEPQVKANYVIGNPPTEWLTDVIPQCGTLWFA